MCVCSVDLLSGDAQLRKRLEQAVFFSDPRVRTVASVDEPVSLADSRYVAYDRTP